MRKIVRRHLNDLSLKSLVSTSLQNWGSDESWGAISELQMRGSPDALSVAKRLAKSPNYRKRAIGLYMASQLRQRRKGIRFGSIEYALDSTQEVLLAGLHDLHSEVLSAAISGFGHRPHPFALPALIKFASHPDKKIRFHVAVALGSYSEADSIDALLRPATDDSDAVRDWATFGIGSMHEEDSPKVRDRLWANLQDNDEDVRGEALVGLAVRKDERIIPLLLKLLNMDCSVFELTAAEAVASPQLLDRLSTIKDSVADDSRGAYWYGRLLDAVDACSTK
jgi:HEAT repeat protein